MAAELGGSGVLVTVDCAVVVGADEVDLVVAGDEPTLFVFLTDALLVTAAIGVVEVAGQSRTYVVSSPSESTEALFVGNSRDTPPCPFETTEIVTVCIAFVFIDVLTEDTKTFEVPAAVMLGTLDVEDAVVELA